VLPLLQRERPTLKFAVVGAAPPPAIERLGSLPGVTVTGQVPDVRPYVHQSAVTVAPLTIARGTQNKILEAVALGVPVVASTAACKGVDMVPGEHLLAADSPADVASRVLEIVASKQYRNSLAERALARVKEKHSWQASMRELDSLIARVTRRDRTGALSRRTG
jgi:glycosyltransferase involved in cell wall biosynthesis